MTEQPHVEQGDHMTAAQGESLINISKIFDERRRDQAGRYELARTALLDVLSDEETQPGTDFITVASERTGLAEADVHYAFLSIERKGEIVQDGERFVVANDVNSNPTPENR